MCVMCAARVENESKTFVPTESLFLQLFRPAMAGPWEPPFQSPPWPGPGVASQIPPQFYLSLRLPPQTSLLPLLYSGII